MNKKLFMIGIGKKGDDGEGLAALSIYFWIYVFYGRV